MSEISGLTPAEIDLRRQAADFDKAPDDPTSIFYKPTPVDGEDQTVVVSKSLGAIALSVVLSEEHSSEMVVAGSPVEDGSEVNDHAYLRPIELTLEAAIGQPMQVGRTTLSNFFYADGSSHGAQAGEATKLVRDSWDALLKLQASRVPFTVLSGLKAYENMLITSLSCRRDASNSMVLQFTAKLRQVKIVKTQETQGEATKLKANTAKSKAKASVADKATNETKGAGSATPIDTQADAGKTKSALASVVDNLNGKP